MKQIVKDYWNSRATLNEKAGTDDLIAKHLEMKAIEKYVKDGMKILDVGCGNGMTAIYLAKKYDIIVVGVDYSEEMVKEAKNEWKKAAGQHNSGLVWGTCGFLQKNVLSDEFKAMGDDYDLVFTERTIINLGTKDEQLEAIRNCINRVKLSSGRFQMLENSQTSLDKINDYRACLSLSMITSPWHNRYLVDDEVTTDFVLDHKTDGVFVGVDNYSSTYYFLSRIVNAMYAAVTETKIDYDSWINQMALELPALDVDFGQGKIWIYKRRLYSGI